MDKRIGSAFLAAFKPSRHVSITVALVLIGIAWTVSRRMPWIRSASQKVPAAQTLRMAESYGKLPLSFEANQGQADSEVQFLSRSGGYSLLLTSTEAVLELQKPQIRNQKSQLSLMDHHLESRPESAIVRMKLLDADRSSQAVGLDELPGRSNYFIGNDPTQWHTNIPTYAKVKFSGVYRGVDLVYYGNQRQLEYDFVVMPGADPRTIRMGIDGAQRVEIDTRGELVLHTPAGDIRQRKPNVYQEIAGLRESVDGHYVLKGEEEIGFEVSSYDPRRPLIIDPVLLYSWLLGQNAEGTGIAVDPAGNAYVSGYTSTIPPQFNPKSGIYVAFVDKLNAAGTALLYSTVLGGNGTDLARAIAVDSAGQAYVTGETKSTDFPLATPLPVGKTYGGGLRDAFVTVLNSGGVLALSTYLGGNGYDWGRGIALDFAGNAYVTGNTDSANFPTVGAPIPGVSAGGTDAFVAKLSFTSASMTLVYSKLLGGSNGDDFGLGIAVDASGDAYIIGSTSSTNFPTVNPLNQGALFNGGTYDAFVSEVDASGSVLIYSTYLGGMNDDTGQGIAVDSFGDAYVTGTTTSMDFPVTKPNIPQPNLVGASDAYVAKLHLSGLGLGLVYSTYLGGDGFLGRTTQGTGIAVDSNLHAWVTGFTNAEFPGVFPIVNPLPCCGKFGGGVTWGDAFVGRLNTSGSKWDFSSYLGGSDDDLGNAIAVDSAGSAYVTGGTYSHDFPQTPFQIFLKGAEDAFAAKIGVVPGVSGWGSAPSLSFRGTQGGANPPNQTLTLTNPGFGTLNWTATANTTSGGNWLRVSPTSGTNSGTLTVSVDITGLTAATYNGSIVLAATDGSIPPATIGVTSTVSPPPANTSICNNNCAPIQLRDPSTGAMAAVTFSSVTQPGMTSVTASTQGPQPPTGFTVGNPALYYDISTTAVFTGPITVSVNYSGVTFTTLPALFHYENGRPVNVTTRVDTLHQIIYGTVNSLSPFAIFQPADTIPPTTTAASSPLPNAAGWNNSNVTITLTAVDEPGGSGVSQIIYSVSGPQPGTSVVGTPATLTISAEGTSTVTYYAKDNAGNAETPKTLTVMLDKTSPAIRTSASSATLWPPNGKLVADVISGTLTDALSGIDPATARFRVIDSYGAVQPAGPIAVSSGSYSFTVMLEASRLGGDLAGRQYQVVISASDKAGNPASATTVVTVPHDQRK